MSESIKAVCALVILVGTVAGATAWLTDRPDGITWCFRVGAPALALLALGGILKLNSRTDLAHDYLRNVAGTYFNRDGFCFTFVPNAIDGIAYLDAYFQNQRDKPSIGRIALRPARGFLMNRKAIETITYEVVCEPAAFGIARIAIPIPEKLQGKSQSFEVGASVEYPDGKGQRLRFHDGLFLRTNANFGNKFHTALIVAGAAGGAIVFSKPAKIKMSLPASVADEIPPELKPKIETLWKLGEPVLKRAA